MIRAKSVYRHVYSGRRKVIHDYTELMLGIRVEAVYNKVIVYYYSARYFIYK